MEDAEQLYMPKVELAEVQRHAAIDQVQEYEAAGIGLLNADSPTAGPVVSPCMSVVLSGELRRTQSAVTHPVGEERKRPLCFAPQSRTRRMKSAPDSRLPHAPTCSQTKINAGRRRWTPSTRPFRAAMARR